MIENKIEAQTKLDTIWAGLKQDNRPASEVENDEIIRLKSIIDDTWDYKVVDDKKVTYRNTPKNAKRVGWDRLEEYCIGDPAAPFVLHDHLTGVFVFVDEDGNEVEQEKWGVFATGGSIGGAKDEPYATYLGKAKAREHASRLRKQLTPGEKGYYGMGFTVRKIKS